MIRTLLSVFLAFTASLSHGQNISGTWTGNYSKNLLAGNPKQLVVELHLYNDSLITGASHLYYNNNRYEHYKLTGVFHKKDSTVYFKEDSTIAVKLGLFISNCLGNYTMKLSFTDSSMLLTGKWKDNSRKFLHCPTTGAWLVRPIDRVKKKIPVTKTDTVLTAAPVAADRNLERTPDIQSAVEIKKAEADSITVSLYDNGEIDHDSVSLYFNDSLIVLKKMISTKPITVRIALDRNIPINKLKLAAESIGEIPPCTALMIITTPTRRYEVNLSSSFSKNAVVDFFLKE